MHIEEDRKIEVKHRGNRLGFWFFKTFLRLFGLRGAYLFLHFPCSYYLLFDAPARIAARAYIQRRFPEYGKWKQLLAIYRLFISQGKILIDCYCMMSRPDLFTFTFKGYDQIKDIVEDQECGFVLLMSHMGNWQAVLSSIRHLQRKVCLLMRPEDNEAVQRALDVTHSSENIKVVSPEQFLGGVVELLKLIQQGYLVSIMGDRCYDFNSVEVDFIGDEAAFPYGAFTIAAGVEAPVIALLSAKKDVYTYEISVGKVFHPRYGSRREKKQNLQQWVQEYAKVLENYTNEHPYQCFLFHDVWAEGEGV